MNLRKEIAEALLLLPGLSLYYFINNNLISCDSSEGKSMEPTFYSPCTLIVDKFFYQKFRKIKKGDIIIAKSPINSSIQICKRIIHLENEEIYNIKIPKNHVWIEGDNKDNSFDSRNHGPIPTSLIKGRVIFSLYPFKRIPSFKAFLT